MCPFMKATYKFCIKYQGGDARLVSNGITGRWRGVFMWLQHRGIVVASTSRWQVRLMAVLLNSIFYL